MVFSSHIFLFYFLPAVLLLYYLMPVRGRNLLLTVVSYVFYGWANPLFMFLLLFSTIVLSKVHVFRGPSAKRNCSPIWHLHSLRALHARSPTVFRWQARSPT